MLTDPQAECIEADFYQDLAARADASERRKRKPQPTKPHPNGAGRAAARERRKRAYRRKMVKRVPSPRPESTLPRWGELSSWPSILARCLAVASAIVIVPAMIVEGLPVIVFVAVSTALVLAIWLLALTGDVLENYLTPEELENRRQQQIIDFIMSDLPPLPPSFAEDEREWLNRRASRLALLKVCKQTGHEFVILSTEGYTESMCPRCGMNAENQDKLDAEIDKERRKIEMLNRRIEDTKSEFV